MNLTINDRSKNVTINTSEIIINGMKNKEILITGKHDIPNSYYADCLRMIIVDENSNEISPHTKVRIIINSKPYIITHYAEFSMYNEYVKNKLKTCNEWYRFPQSFVLRENDKLIIKLEDFFGSISKKKTKFALDVTMSDKNNSIL